MLQIFTFSNQSICIFLFLFTMWIDNLGIFQLKMLNELACSDPGTKRVFFSHLIFKIIIILSVIRKH